MKDIWTTFKKVIEKKTRYIPYKVYSNCITEIPRRINAEIEDNILTLKSGSSMWYPNGDTYSEVSNSNDLTLELPTTAGRFVICMSFAGSALFARNILNCVSGSGVTTTSGFAFDTDAKTIRNYSGSGSAGGRYCAPFCLIDVVDGVASFAKDSHGNDMIFNGAGFIGHHIFVYPNVKWLSTNGFDENNRLKSEIQTTSSLQIIELLQNFNCLAPYNPNTIVTRNYVGEFDTYEDLPSVSIDNPIAYVKNENIMCYGSNWQRLPNRYTPLIYFSYDGTAVTKFDIRQPYEGAAEQTLYEPEEYEVEYDRTFLNVGDTAVFKAKNILETQEGSLAYEPDLGIDLKRFLDPDIKIQNRTFEAYSIQKLSEQGINTIELLSNEETFRQLFDYKVAETDKEGMIAQ